MNEQRMMQLNQAFRDQNRDKINQILELAEVDRILKMEDENKYTPLFWACSSLSENLALEIVPKILQKGADPFKMDSYQQNVLYYIAK
jgi:ankyrin repeat protein